MLRGHRVMVRIKSKSIQYHGKPEFQGNKFQARNYPQFNVTDSVKMFSYNDNVWL